MSDAPLFEPRPPDLPGLWIKDSGPENDVVVSSRMRLARNLRGYHFKPRQEEDEGKRLTEHLHGVLSGLDHDLRWFDMEELSPTLRLVLFERHLVSREHVDDERPRGLAYTTDGTVGVMVNEEDHLRFQVFAPGLNLEAISERIEALDNEVASRVEYSFSEQYGYLTSCPTNTGTGLRVSVMLHLPALAYRTSTSNDDEPGIVKVNNAAQQLGLTVRGIHGESSKAEGDFFQISNQVTLGRSPDQAVGDLRDMLGQVIEWERQVRQILLEDDRLSVEDLVLRSWAVLRHARRIASEEALQLLSSVRLGACLGLIDGVGVTTIHDLMVSMLPGHLQFRDRAKLSPDERDAMRATLIRNALAHSGPTS